MSTRGSHEPPDPDPDRTPGLEQGGSVPPGETPPESASATEGLSYKTKPSARPTKWIWLIAIAVVVVLVAAFFISFGAGLLGY
ncbi:MULTISPECIES: DUF6480 family protein [Saccharopolyspora]|uniref:Uncharacterized protein n=1 Tax=Saccharopolyspora elongata TaxID=2530387 RepID=A0A4R4YUZ8_9PSEU|nr:DUF6480 family protein [Saccharopolyspora elongata]TDD48139.1 hypothetical protein E1288_22865 [Saccharopolyspora elongata]